MRVRGVTQFIIRYVTALLVTLRKYSCVRRYARGPRVSHLYYLLIVFFMFKVTFSNSKVLSPFEVSNVNSLEEAVSLALALHRSSNCPHVVCVYHDFDQKISFELFDKSDENDV